MMEVDKKKTRTDEAWVRLYARFETDCLLPADAAKHTIPAITAAATLPHLR